VTAILGAAMEALAAGASVLPARRDGSKVPLALPIPIDCDQRPCVDSRDRAQQERRPPRGWKHFTHARLDPGHLAAVFQRAEGLCVVTGAISGDVALLESDDIGVADQLREAAGGAGLSGVMARLDLGYLELTPSGGTHWLVHVDGGPGGNQKLARRPKRGDEMIDPGDRVKVLLETRGEGGQAVVAPSGGRTHPSGRSYRLVAGGFATIPTLAAEEWDSLLAVARSLDEMPTPVPRPARRPHPYTGDSVIEQFNARASWSEILERHGWRLWRTVGDNEHWTRPGKRSSTSATINEDGDGVLYVFSSSTPFEPDRAYSKFGAYAVLEHGGDHSQAAQAIRAWWAAA